MRTALAFVLIGSVVVTSLGCGTGDPGEPGAKPQTSTELVVEPVKIAADPAALGKVVAVAEMAESFVAFGDKGAIAIQGGLPSNADDGVTAWSGSAAAVAAADGSGRWPIAIDHEGRLLRLREDGHIEEVGLRYGLSQGEKAKAIVKADETSFVIVLDAAIVAVDTTTGKTKRFDTGPLSHVSATTGRVAGATLTHAVAIDLVAGKQTRFEASAATATAFDADKLLLVLTEHAVLREVPGDGALGTVVNRPDATLHGLAATPQRIWFGAGAELYALDPMGAKLAKGTTLDSAATLAGSESGDVWVLGGQLTRIKASTAGGNETLWNAEVLPIYQNVCAACHAPAGSAGIDLSTYSRWVEKKAAIRDRVVDKQTMPPKPRTLTPEQIDAIRRWTE